MHNRAKGFSGSVRFLLVILVIAAAAYATIAVKENPELPEPVDARSAVQIDEKTFLNQLQSILADYRKIIVLLAHEESLSSADSKASAQVGQNLFHANLARIDSTNRELEKLFVSANPGRFDTLSRLLDYVESGTGMYDADRLAFRELLHSMQRMVASDGTLPAIKVHKRISEDLEALNEIETMYEKELRQVFSHFDRRAIQLKRERWDDYVAQLNKLYSRDQILKQHGVIVPYTAPKAGTTEAVDMNKEVISGRELPPKTLVLTFDDGPHPVFSEEIKAILKQYNIPGVFFNVGRNLGTVAEDGTAKISKLGEVSHRLINDGFIVGNHSYTHAELSKKTDDALRAEINTTDTLLKALDAKRAPLFRFPYGAHNSEGDKLLIEAKLKSVMWNIDSLDWADPIPSSIEARVMNGVHKEGSGIILFHDIHERTVKALPTLLDRLISEGYQFAGWDGSFFDVPASAAKESKRAETISSDYGGSWAVVIGIDKYAKWPQLNYAANDARAIRQLLIDHYNFPSDHVISLLDEDASRNGILSTFHEVFANQGVKKDDRIFVFFAGHGATRKLSSGRDLGYIIPVDSEPGRFDTDAIPMTEIQNIAENLPAKHVLFVMDACYSGLGLTRGARSWSYLRDNAKRIGRQMLTAGGADQMVADGGPNGHSIFSWTLLQGLDGKADLNGDNLITATELAAYVAPAVSSISQQTPAFGSLPGSEGGEFVFELTGDTEYLNAQSAQLNSEAIALNTKLDTAVPSAQHGDDNTAAKTASITVNDLQGKGRKLTVPAPVLISVKQMAQRANDRGLQFYKEQNYNDAEAQFTEALKLRPNFALAANNLGFVYYKQARFKEAVVWFENTVKMDPSRAIAYVNLGDAYLQVGEREKAKSSFKTYIELLPTGANADYCREQLAKL